MGLKRRVGDIVKQRNEQSVVFLVDYHTLQDYRGRGNIALGLTKQLIQDSNFCCGDVRGEERNRVKRRGGDLVKQ